MSGDNDDAVDNLLKSKDTLPKAKTIIDPPAANVLHMFNLSLSSTLSIPIQLYYGKTGLPFVPSVINQLQLTNENVKSTIQSSIGIIIPYIYLQPNILFQYLVLV